MRRRLAIAALVWFVAGMVLLPAAHLAALHGTEPCCDAAHEGGEPTPSAPAHDPDHCSICQFVDAPLDVGPPAVAPVLRSGPPIAICLPAVSPPARVPHLLPFIRGPPR